MKYLLLLFLIFSKINFAQASEYSFSYDLSPIKISYKDCANILSNAVNFIKGVNDSSDYIPKVNLIVYHSKNSYTYTSIELPNILRDAPQIAYDIDFNFSSYENKISTLSINFNDYSRQIRVEGKSYENCKALITMLENEFQPYTVTFGGTSFRTWSGIILYILAFGILWFPQIIKTNKIYIYVLSTVTFILLIISIYTLPWEKWLPGFTIFSSYKNFIEEYSGEISVIGILLTIFSIIISIYYSKRNIEQKNNNEQVVEQNKKAN